MLYCGLNSQIWLIRRCRAQKVVPAITSNPDLHCQIPVVYTEQVDLYSLNVGDVHWQSSKMPKMNKYYTVIVMCYKNSGCFCSKCVTSSFCWLFRCCSRPPAGRVALCTQLGSCLLHAHDSRLSCTTGQYGSDQRFIRVVTRVFVPLSCPLIVFFCSCCWGWCLKRWSPTRTVHERRLWSESVFSSEHIFLYLRLNTARHCCSVFLPSRLKEHWALCTKFMWWRKTLGEDSALSASTFRTTAWIRPQNQTCPLAWSWPLCFVLL